MAVRTRKPSHKFSKEQAFVRDHRSELREKYPGKYLAVINNQILAVYDTIGEAFRETSKTHKPGNFMIKGVPARPEDDPLWPDTVIYVL